MVKFSRLYFETLLKESGYFEDQLDKVEVRAHTIFDFKTKDILIDFEMGKVIQQTLFTEREAINRHSGIKNSVKVVEKESIENIPAFFQHL